MSFVEVVHLLYLREEYLFALHDSCLMFVYMHVL
jgi:hypothetical protein